MIATYKSTLGLLAGCVYVCVCTRVRVYKSVYFVYVQECMCKHVYVSEFL